MKRPVMTRALACLGATFLAGCLDTVTIAAPHDEAQDTGQGGVLKTA